MAKRNRQRKVYFKPANIKVVLALLIMIMPWAYYGVRTLQHSQEAGKVRSLELEKRSLEEKLRRHTAEWNQAIVPDRLEEAAARNGLKMDFALPSRVVSVDSNGNLRNVPAELIAEHRAAQQAKAEALAAAAPAPAATTATPSLKTAVAQAKVTPVKTTKVRTAKTSFSATRAKVTPKAAKPTVKRGPRVRRR